jgi:tetratricopeptide (TPR) repeat protein
MQAFAERFGDGPKANLLALLGLFDRPAEAAAIAALKAKPAIPELTEHLVDLSAAAWEEEIADLRCLGLLAPASYHAPDELDAHPLVREHFGARLEEEQPESWQAGHGRLYEYLRDSTENWPDTFTRMAPLFQAMHHGCQAGRHTEALSEVYRTRIQRGDEYFSQHKLGAFGADLAALAGFFDQSWARPLAVFEESMKTYLMNAAYLDLRGLARLKEAVAPLKTTVKTLRLRRIWRGAAINAANLVQVYLELGFVPSAVALAKVSIVLADQSGDASQRIINRCHLAVAWHQAGQIWGSRKKFEEAEALQAKFETDKPRLYSLGNYYYCDLLLADGRPGEVRERASYAIEIARRNEWLLDIALDRVSLGRAALAQGEHLPAKIDLDEGVNGLRHAGDLMYLPRGLLARAGLFREIGDFSGARRDLKEAMRIGKRSEMRLFQCDAHLEYARLALAAGDKDQARAHVAEGRRLVEETGYGRRRPEIEALETQLGRTASFSAAPPSVAFGLRPTAAPLRSLGSSAATDSHPDMLTMLKG